MKEFWVNWRTPGEIDLQLQNAFCMKSLNCFTACRAIKSLYSWWDSVKISPLTQWSVTFSSDLEDQNPRIKLCSLGLTVAGHRVVFAEYSENQKINSGRLAPLCQGLWAQLGCVFFSPTAMPPALWVIRYSRDLVMKLKMHPVMGRLLPAGKKSDTFDLEKFVTVPQSHKYRAVPRWIIIIWYDTTMIIEYFLIFYFI